MTALMSVLWGGLIALSSEAEAPEMPLGFVSHFPMIQHEDEAVASAGASVVIVRAPWSLLEPTEGQFDFRLLEEQLRWADRQGLKLVILLEAGPAHAAGVPWLVEKLQARGETQVEMNGKPVRDPSLFSPTYREYLSRFIHRTVEYLRGHPLYSVVYGYDNGCEWWFPLGQSYGPLATGAFRGFLQGKYARIEALNRRWGTSFSGWEEVVPPRLVPFGVGFLSQGTFLPATAALDVGYATTEQTHLPVTPGQRLKFEAQYETDALLGGAARAEIAWLGAGQPPLLRIDLSDPGCDRGKVGTLRVEAAAPPGAARAWLHLKALGPGRVIFRRVACWDENGRQLAPNPDLDPGQQGWQFIPWTAGEPEKLTSVWAAPGQMEIRYLPSGKLDSQARYPLAEVYDWFDFRATAVARFLDGFASEIHEADPTRPVVTYLTFSFASPFEWDYAQLMGICVDRVAACGSHEEVLGMQLAGSAGDFDSVTCALDLVRKYQKPMWAIDLLDFSLGVGLGQPGLTQLSQAVLQHGGSGIQYYCWWGTPVYNYAELGAPALREMTDQVRAMAGKLVGAHPLCPVALVQPRMPLYAFLPEPPNDWADFMGWYKLLVRLGICPDVYTLEELPEAELDRYQAVIVPDGAYLSRAALEKLRSLRPRGIRLISSGRFARRDLSGRPLPITAKPRPDTRFDGPVGAAILGTTYRHPSPTDTPRRLRGVEKTLQLGRPEIAAIEACLQRAGIPVLHPVGPAPLTSVPFQRGRARFAFVLPETAWSGTAQVGGKRCSVASTGTLVRLREKD
jgi:hypothetical protein